MKKRSVVLLFLLIGFAIITTTYAFTVTPIQNAVSFVESPRTDSNRGVSSYEAHPLGEDSVYVKFTVASGSEYTNIGIRVMPLGSTNNVLTAGGLVSGATIQQNMASEGWGVTVTPIDDTFDIIWEYSVSNTAAFDVTIAFEDEDIAASFVTCMIEIREWGTP